ncbi:nicotinate-nucleotide adenylyltransferase [Catenovulum adriaticum]|uniref:Probable nicotinate-nucleotide adenylyltransferase n=1 Tax=Catenovulum adriaticum TaxID=2984846 RepID=A0ABY7AM48_9ALTE|nr:nicotinate-nucleotide adenylyltransferase [Catenovulum sp. TS8]WAJ70619.1 nicotinate-nucleotide adenylyltransferase [Catenovulum sp. TS8]
MTLINSEQPLPIAIYFGGTFNPIHHGHLQVALEVSETLNADSVHLLPNYLPPHKASPDVSAQQRAKMCELACLLDPKFKLDSRELNSAEPSYTIATLKQLKAEHPNRALCFMIGMDSLQTLDTWRNWRQLTKYCHLVVAARGGYPAQFNENVRQLLASNQTFNPQDLQTKQSGCIYLVETSELMISASQIRQRYQKQQNCRCLLPDKVNDYIIQHHLYTHVDRA